MPSVGSGAYEIRIRDDTGAFRVLYVAKFSEAIYVLHVFQKKTQKTAKRDLDLAMKTTFSSVWDAIEDSRDEAEAMKARAEIMRALQKVVRGWSLSQKAAAIKLGVTQPRLNDLLRGKIDRFSLDALFNLTAHAGLKISIALKRAA